MDKNGVILGFLMIGCAISSLLIQSTYPPEVMNDPFARVTMAPMLLFVGCVAVVLGVFDKYLMKRFKKNV